MVDLRSLLLQYEALGAELQHSRTGLTDAKAQTTELERRISELETQRGRADTELVALIADEITTNRIILTQAMRALKQNDHARAISLLERRQLPDEAQSPQPEVAKADAPALRVVPSEQPFDESIFRAERISPILRRPFAGPHPDGGGSEVRYPPEEKDMARRYISASEFFALAVNSSWKNLARLQQACRTYYIVTGTVVEYGRSLDGRLFEAGGRSQESDRAIKIPVYFNTPLQEVLADSQGLMLMQTIFNTELPGEELSC